MKPKALSLAILMALVCITHTFARINNPQNLDHFIVDHPQNILRADTLIIALPDTLPQTLTVSDTISVGLSTENKDTSGFPAYKMTKQFVRDFGHTSVDVAIYPFAHWQNRDYLKAGILLGVSGLTYATLDDPIKAWAQRTRNSHSAFFSNQLQLVGQGYISAGIVASFEIYGIAFKQKKARRVAVLSAESFLISTGICTVIKHLAGRARPNTEADHDQWYGPQLTHKSQTSFFSGHTTAIFSVATVIAIEYKDHKWIPPTIYTLATLAAASRIHDNKHWTSDVVFAALLSHYVAKTVVRLHEKMGNKFYLAPEIAGNYNGLALLYCF